MDQAACQGTSGAAKVKKRVTKYCCVPECSNYYRAGLSFHLFPQSRDQKKRWEDALKMGKPATSRMYVCGDHFLPSDYFPSGKLVNTSG